MNNPYLNSATLSFGNENFYATVVEFFLFESISTAIITRTSRTGPPAASAWACATSFQSGLYACLCGNQTLIARESLGQNWQPGWPEHQKRC